MRQVDISLIQSLIITGDVTGGSVTVLSPDLQLSSTSVDFGRVALQSSGSAMVELRNAGNEPLMIGAIVSSNAQFTSGYASGVQVDAGQSVWMIS